MRRCDGLDERDDTPENDDTPASVTRDDCCRATTAGDVLGNTADLAAVLCDDEWRAAGTRNALDDSLNLGRDGCAVPFHIRGDGIHGPLADLPAIQVDA